MESLLSKIEAKRQQKRIIDTAEFARGKDIAVSCGPCPGFLSRIPAIEEAFVEENEEDENPKCVLFISNPYFDKSSLLYTPELEEWLEKIIHAEPDDTQFALSNGYAAEVTRTFASAVEEFQSEWNIIHPDCKCEFNHTTRKNDCMIEICGNVKKQRTK